MNKNINDKNTEKPFTLDIPPVLEKKFEIFSSQIRLSVLLIMYTHRKVKIVELQKAFNITSGKLEHHLNILENENLLKKKMDLSNKRAYSTIEMTKKGKNLLLEYLDKMSDVLKQIENKKSKE